MVSSTLHMIHSPFRTERAAGHIHRSPPSRHVPLSIPSRVAGGWEKATGKCYYTHSCPVGASTDTANCKVTTVKDLYTQEMVLAVAKEICRLTSGYCPHVVLNNLSRSKLDPNREKDEAAFGVPEAEQAWDEFMGFIRTAKSSMSQGLVIDIHGHSHSEGWVELGYLISKANLDSGEFSDSDTSVFALAKTTFDSLLRGSQSLGKLIEEQNNDMEADSLIATDSDS
ncbi:uncharacterized protein PAF06_020080 [Gastrophryne carolinensis]